MKYWLAEGVVKNSQQRSRGFDRRNFCGRVGQTEKRVDPGPWLAGINFFRVTE